MGVYLAKELALLGKLKQRVCDLKAETFALYLAARDPRTPWYAKLLVGGIVAYAFSPIDLIPDFVPVLGYLDDLILIPLGITLAIKMVPQPVLAECRALAEKTIQNGKPVSRIAGAVIIAIWLLLVALCTVWGYEAFNVKSRARPTRPSTRTCKSAASLCFCTLVMANVSIYRHSSIHYELRRH